MHVHRSLDFMHHIYGWKSKNFSFKTIINSDKLALGYQKPKITGLWLRDMERILLSMQMLLPWKMTQKWKNIFITSGMSTCKLKYLKKTTKKPKRTAKKFLRAFKTVAIWIKKRISTLRLMMMKKTKNLNTCGLNSIYGKNWKSKKLLRKIWKQNTN